MTNFLPPVKIKPTIIKLWFAVIFDQNFNFFISDKIDHWLQIDRMGFPDLPN